MDIMKILVELYLHQIGVEATVETEPLCTSLDIQVNECQDATEQQDLTFSK